MENGPFLFSLLLCWIHARMHACSTLYRRYPLTATQIGRGLSILIMYNQITRSSVWGRCSPWPHSGRSRTARPSRGIAVPRVVLHAMGGKLLRHIEAGWWFRETARFDDQPDRIMIYKG